MKEEKEKPEENAIDKDRRRISKAAAASPLLATLASPSVWGNVCSVSGLQSGNVSGHPQDNECAGHGCTPGYWKNHTDAWPPGFSPGTCTDTKGNGNCKAWSYTGATPISEILNGHSVGVFGASGYDNSTAIFEILNREDNGNGNTNSQLAHWIAGIFNALVAPSIYGSSVGELLGALDTAVAGTPFDVPELIDVLTRMNESGNCFLSGGNGNAELSCNEFNDVQYIYHPESGNCIPVCPSGYEYDWATKSCVPEGQATSFDDYCDANPGDFACY